jgi:hypothetical protein
VNWRRLLCLIGWHKPVIVTELPVKAIVSGGSLSIPIDHLGGVMQFKGKVVCLWCEKGLKATIELHRAYEVDENGLC